MFSKLIFGCDLSVDSLILAKKAKAIADSFNAELSLIHVVELPVVYGSQWIELGNVVADKLGSARKALEEFGAILDIPLPRQFVLTGTPWMIMMDFIKEHPFDGLILGSHGVGGQSHLLGSTTQAVVNINKCPVLVLKTQCITAKQREHEKLFYARHTSFNQDYPSEGAMKPKTAQSIKNEAKSSARRITWGSEQGVSQATKRGSRPIFRMPGAPYDSQDSRDPDKDEPDNQDTSPDTKGDS